MNHEHDLISRVVDYHDHIAAPPVPVDEDLRRGRRRVRRNLGLVTGGAVLGLISMMTALALLTGGRPADPPQPAERPGLTTPLVSPTSLLDVSNLGFHVEPGNGIFPEDSWSLTPESQGTQVTWTAGEGNKGASVNVYYQGRTPQLPADMTGQAVTVNGAPGTYYEAFGGPGGHWRAQLVWEYLPGSWAEIIGANDHSPPPQAATRPAFLKIAEAVRSGGPPVRLPFRVGAGRGPLPTAADASSVSLQPADKYGTGGWEVAFQPGVILDLSVNGTWCDPDAEPFGYGDVQPFTYRGYTGCVRPGILEGPQPGTVVLRVGVVDRVIEGASAGYAVADLKRMLAQLTVAPSEDPATWFDVRTALGN